MEVRELLDKYEFPGRRHAGDPGFGAGGVGGGEDGARRGFVVELVRSLDEYIPEPERAVDGGVSDAGWRM